MRAIPRFVRAAVIALAAIAAAPGLADARGADDTDTAAGKFDTVVRLIEQANYERAIELLQDAIRREPDDADAHNYLGFSHRKMGRYDEAFAAYRRALALNPQHLGANEYIGEAYLETGDLAMAEQHLARLAALCGTECEEYLDLKEAMDAFKSRGEPGAAAARPSRGGW